MVSDKLVERAASLDILPPEVDCVRELSWCWCAEWWIFSTGCWSTYVKAVRCTSRQLGFTTGGANGALQNTLLRSMSPLRGPSLSRWKKGVMMASVMNTERCMSPLVPPRQTTKNGATWTDAQRQAIRCKSARGELKSWREPEAAK